MIVIVRDLDILSNLDPKRITTYLLEQGWLCESIVDNKESVWVLPGDTGEVFDITLPLNPTIRAYALRMIEILETLEKVEKRSQLDILSDLVTTIPNTSVEGMVIQLTDRTDSSYVIVMGFVIGKLRQIKLMLSKSEYSVARTAYTERLAVICSGDLISDDGILVLKNPHISIYDTFITPVML